MIDYLLLRLNKIRAALIMERNELDKVINDYQDLDRYMLDLDERLHLLLSKLTEEK